MSYITFEELPDIRRKNPNKTIVYCSGCFDLLHAGHILFLEDCKKLGDILVVGVGDDESLKRYKGDSRPILNEQLRLKAISALKVVDYCFLNMNYKKEDPTFNIDQDLGWLRPDIYVFNKDAFDLKTRKLIAKKYGIKVCVLDRWCPEEFENISTTKIIEKIKSLS